MVWQAGCWPTLRSRRRRCDPPLPLSRMQVRRLLSQHSGVQHLNARGVPFSPADIAFLVPQLTCAAAAGG